LSLLVGLSAGAPLAATVIVPAGDFLPTYTGPTGGDLDVLTSDVVYNTINNTFTFSATLNGAIGTTPGAVYVWGLNRGTGTEQFVGGTPSVGAGVAFDAVFIALPDGTGLTNLLDGNPGATLPGVVQVSGNSLVATIDAALFPSTGSAIPFFTYNLWPRSGADPSMNNQISDFAPDASNLKISMVPEPMSLGLLGLATLGLLGLRRARA
jgi:hypothetical protein